VAIEAEAGPSCAPVVENPPSVRHFIVEYLAGTYVLSKCYTAF
jgi:hypothetical protein